MNIAVLSMLSSHVDEPQAWGHMRRFLCESSFVYTPSRIGLVVVCARYGNLTRDILVRTRSPLRVGRGFLVTM